jgi:integrase
MKARGLGRVYQRPGTQNWWVEFSFRGKKHRESSNSTRHADAVKLLRRRQAEMGSGRLVGHDAERITFEDLAKLLTTDYEVNGRKSLERAKHSTARLREFFSLRRALEIDAGLVNTYIKQRLTAGAAPATVQREIAALKRMLTLALQAGMLAQRPYIPTIRADNVRQGFLEEPEFRAVQEELRPDVADVVEFLFWSGWRKGEALPLTWSQVDFAAGVVRLEPGSTKSGDGRTLPFDALPQLAALLHRRRELTSALEEAQGRIIPEVFHRNGKPIHRLEGAWRAACRRAGLEGRLIHDMRRGAVRRLERAGVARSVAMAITGHRTESVYRRYAITCEADLREGLAKVAGLLEAEARQGRKVIPLPARKGTVEAQSDEKRESAIS